MPCSTLFHGYIRTMSLGPTTTTTTNSLALFKTHRKFMAVEPPRLLGFFARHRTYYTRNVGFWNVYRAPRYLACRELTCLASSGTVEVNGGQSRQRQRQKGAATPPLWQQQSLNYGRYAYQDASSSEDSDREVGSSRKEPCGSTLDNIDEWSWKLTMLLRNEEEQEVISREKKDRRDFDQLSALAARMGLYSRQYNKVVVFSKAPLPNYRSDLDTKRPQREVIIPYGLQSEVDYLLRAHLSQKASGREGLSDNLLSRSSSRDSIVSDEGFYEQQEPSVRRSVAMEKILQHKSLNMRNQQQEWQESPEGQKMLELRKSLPAYKEREALLKVISENQVVVVSGETGCGKTTQLPQYILESEIEAARGAFCNIICTQPRRISAMSVSERVAAERGETLGESVGYKVRLEGMKGRDTRLLFCTTGILLRRLLVDRTLRGVTHVIVDEIHERGMNEDFLLIVLKELLPRRPELRLILMSATLNADLFSSFFGGAPTMHIPGFTYPVRAHFLENILEITGYQLTQYNQIDDYGQEKSWKMQKQAQSVRKRKSQIASSVEDALEAADFREYNPKTRESLSCWNPDSIGFNLIECVLCHIIRKERSGAILVFMTGWDDINSLKDQLQSHPLLGDPSRVLLLACHGSMPSSEQKLIFDKPEDGVRKIVLATNMAETSITINDVVFVVDCGKAKETSYDALNNTPCLLPSWISKAAARQRRGRAGRVQPGECYHLYPRCVYDAFSDYQLPELLRTPLQSLCLQIKSLRLGSISEFLSKALQPPEPLSVQNAVEYLKIIGALNEDENLTSLGRNLSMLPVEPKLGKMLILGAIFNCLDPVMTVVAGLSSRDPFLMPFDKKDLAESAKAQFSAREYSDHLALVRAYEGWKEAEREQSGYEYCWRNFLSAQTLKAIDSLRKQFFYLLEDTGLVDRYRESCNTWSHDEHLIRAIICAGLFPGLCSVMNKERSIVLKTMEDGQVLLYSNSVNAGVPKIPYPWLVFNEKVKVNSVFLRDSTAVSDSVLLLFGGSITRGGLDGHLKMLGGYLEFFMKPALAETYIYLKKELDELIQMKLLNPKLDIQSHPELLSALRLLVSGDQCEGRFVFGRQIPIPKKAKKEIPPVAKGGNNGSGGNNSKNHLQTLLARAGHESPTYKTKQLKNNQFRSTVIFNGLDFAGSPCSSKKLAEKDAASEALLWLQGENHSSSSNVDHMSMLLKKTSKKKSQKRKSFQDAKWG
ncbi:DExH-box ATP-dependent RNA helicase DExH3-like [Humulus lupulus]|uniref:DExH-box ATP-dependent RNA helicase DExH3-like n=1 Tax=Humulus lupulus TaxID=3486 RepID=UPI002B412AFA|nr:DExH-box ATP-dependent RNA helicase DExH3-like [Humulus lupulus]